MEKMLSYCSEEDRQEIEKERFEAVENALRGFDVLDLNNDGFVEKHDLIEMTRSCMELTDEEIQEFFVNIDTTSTIICGGNISKNDW